MKRILCLSVSLFLIALVASGQAKLTFDKVLHDFGKVNEGDGPVSYDFTFKNTGSAPLIIQDVKTTCGCTTPEWTRQPIRPGATGFIKVSYDVKGRPGTIDKTISVYSNSKPAQNDLRINGEVAAVDRHPTEAYRYTAGTIRMDDMHVSFNRVYSYEKSSLTVTAYNPGPDPAKISFINLPAHIKVEVQPATIKKGEKASVKVSYDATKKRDWGFVSDRISMILNDNKTKDYKLTVTANIEEDFSRWTAAQLQQAPVVVLDNMVIEIGDIKKGQSKEYKLKLTNSGKGKLLIRKAECNSTQVTVKAPQEVAAGASSDIVVRFDSGSPVGEQNKVITMITNDPKNALISVKVKANVLE